MTMKMNKLLSSLVAIFVGVILFAPAHSLAAAFGVSPPWIENENMKPGSNIVYVIDVSANSLPEDMIIHSAFDGDAEIAKWLTVQNKNDLFMPKGNSTVQVLVNVNIPENAKLGKYNGNIKLSIAPVSGSIPQNSIAILLGSNIKVKLNIVDYDVNAYEVRSASAERIAEGEFIALKVSIKNLGNTTVSSVMTKLSVVDKRTGEEVFSALGDKHLSTSVYPHAMTDIKLSFEAPDLKQGEYWANLELYNGNESIYKIRLFLAVDNSETDSTVKTAVDVTKNGQVRSAAPGEVVSLGSNSNNADVETSVRVRALLTNQLIVVIIGILLVMTGVIVKFYVTFKKRRR